VAWEEGWLGVGLMVGGYKSTKSERKNPLFELIHNTKFHHAQVRGEIVCCVGEDLVNEI
jgi:hypothetical protein